MWVHDVARGTGAAEALVRQALESARVRGATVARLHVTEGNDRAERLYERHGFVRAGAAIRRQRDGMLEIEMERWL